MNRRETMIQPPLGRGGDGRTVDVFSYADKVGPFFGKQPIYTGPYAPNTPGYYQNLKCTFLTEAISDTFADMNKDNWFFQYFPKLKETADYEVEMITMMSMNVFTPNKIRPGALATTTKSRAPPK
jgi:hypothetical protein